MVAEKWYRLRAAAVVKQLQSDEKRGLTEKEAARRLRQYGPNELESAPPVSGWEIFWAQFQDFMILVLMGATAISFLLGEVVDAIAILAIVFVNAILGFIQEYRAERSLQALQELAAPYTLVTRDGKALQIDSRELVPGDIVTLEGGDRVPADIRLLQTNMFQVEEAALTGESIPVTKDAERVLTGDVALGDTVNMAFMGTTVTKGRAIGIVVSTGMDTEIGKIADLIGTADDEETPLQRRLHQLGKWLLAGSLLVVALVFVAGVLRGFPVYRMFLTAVSLAVAAIPEGLPAVVTIALALGVQRMIKRNAIVRRLPAVESLGCATVICSDKTGTLTQNQMTVTEMALVGRRLQVTGSGYTPVGEVLEDRRPVSPDAPDLALAAKVCAICNHAQLQPRDSGAGLMAAVSRRLGLQGRSKDYQLFGDPTEGALLVLAAKLGQPLDESQRRNQVIGELPFDSDRKRMTTITQEGGRVLAWVKGAPDVILPLCNRVQDGGRVRPITASDLRQMRRINESMAQGALRVLALAYRELPSDRSRRRDWVESEVESQLVLVGLVGMIDPPRPEARQAIRVAAEAGIRTIMVTGDHLQTAEAVALQLGLIKSGQRGLAGTAIDAMSDEELRQVLRTTSVFARVSPRHKLRIVRALKADGEVVAMTGDGVNDAPAIKEADIGVSMGINGTDVTKEASDMVLADDNFATIVAAVEEGRGIYDNIRKFIRYLLGCNVGEVLTMFLATMLSLPLPLVPIQILWMNLVTDGLPAIALGVDPVHPSVMQRPPRDADEGVFSRGLHVKILVRGFLIGTCTLLVFVYELFMNSRDLDIARTMAFTTLVMSQLFFVFQCRSEDRGILEVGLFTNPYLVIAVLISLGMQIAVMYLPWLQPVFKTVALGWQHWQIVLIFSGWSIVADIILRGIRSLFSRRVATVTVGQEVLK